jgi:hypothetical protein
MAEQESAATPDLSIYPRLAEIIGSFPTAQYTRALTLLGVPDAVAGGPRHVSDLAVALGAHRPTLTRYLRCCAMLGLLTEDEPEVFGTTPMGKLLESDNMFHGMTRATAGMHHYLPYTKVVECIRTGRSMGEETLGMPFFDYLESMREELVYYYQLIALTSGDCGAAVSGVFDFTPYKTIADVGGHFGAMLADVLRAAPGSRGVLFDRPAAMTAARAHLDGQGLTDRVALHGGNIIDEPPPADADLYLLKTVLWEHDDERASRILRNVAAVMSPSAKLLIIENFLPELSYASGEELDHFTRELHRVNFSVVLQRGGRVRTEAEYREMVADAGLSVERTFGVQGSPTVEGGTRRRWDLIEVTR